MGKESAIGWTDNTFNPWWGCVEVSPACDNCYAREWDARFAEQDAAHWGKEAPRRFFPDKHWNEPLKWNRAAAKEQAEWDDDPYPDARPRTLVFCASMADVFEQRDDLDPWREKLWTLIEATQALTWLLLTKRPQNIKRLLPPRLVGARNIWLGTTIESPAYLWRADSLIENTEAAVRFVSMEPLIEETSIVDHLAHSHRSGIDWVIIGCESGDGARHTPTDWYRRIVKECAATGVPCFLKQAPLGADGITEGAGSHRKRDLRTGPDGIKRVHQIIAEPYLDGVQHAAFPEIRP